MMAVKMVFVRFFVGLDSKEQLLWGEQWEFWGVKNTFWGSCLH